jgi:AcrR family transcriptional regulator
MTVSRETLAQSASVKARSYQSPHRQSRSDRTKAAILETALSFVSEGYFRPEAREIAARAASLGKYRFHCSAVTRHFGSLQLLYRVIARQHWVEVIRGAGIVLGCPNERDLAWLIMVGRKREP